MAHRPTPALMEAIYTMLCSTQPFKKWNFPHADEVEFAVRAFRNRRHVAYYEFPGRPTGRRFRRIAINAKHVWHTTALITVMAHEMCHLKEISEPKPDADAHGPKFMKLARQVCRAHGFDIDKFYI